jgi:phage FluMu protein Com
MFVARWTEKLHIRSSTLLESDCPRQKKKNQFSIKDCTQVKKVKLSLYRPWRPLMFREVEAPTFAEYSGCGLQKYKPQITIYKELETNIY